MKNFDSNNFSTVVVRMFHQHTMLIRDSVLQWPPSAATYGSRLPERLLCDEWGVVVRHVLFSVSERIHDSLCVFEELFPQDFLGPLFSFIGQDEYL